MKTSLNKDMRLFISVSFRDISYVVRGREHFVPTSSHLNSKTVF